MSDYFYVDKITGTFTDELLTAGFTRLLENLFHRQGEADPEIIQTDFGHYYQIQVSPTLDVERLGAETAPFVLAPILRTVKNSKNLPDLPDDPFYVVGYEREKEKLAAFFAAYKELEGTLKRAYAIGDDDNFPFVSMPPPPHDRWNVFTLLNAPPMPINGYNKLMTQWLAVGDAASIFDPLSSQGIVKALRSGVFASYAIADLLLNGDDLGLRRYRRYVQDEFEGYAKNRAQYYGEERRWPESEFWRRRWSIY